MNTDQFRKDFRDALFCLINDKGWTYTKTAERCGIEYQSLKAYLSGRALPKAENVRKLCDGFHVDPYTFIFPEWVRGRKEIDNVDPDF